jgi:uncharacterized glyoxalase superfamily protein PhnB
LVHVVFPTIAKKEISMSQAQPIPEGFHALTPHLLVADAAGAIKFYGEAFGAEERYRMPGPGGKGIMHAEISIGDSIVMLCDEMPMMEYWRSPSSVKGTTVCLHLYVEDVDLAFQRAVTAGAKVSMPVMDTFWGDRYGKVTDPFGHEWSLATHVEDLTPEEMTAGAEKFFSSMSDGC